MFSSASSVEQRCKIDPLGQRVDRHRFFRSRHLHDAQDRPIGALAHEFGVDRDKFRAFLPGAEGGERAALGNQLHCEGYTPKRRPAEPLMAAAPAPSPGRRTTSPTGSVRASAALPAQGCMRCMSLARAAASRIGAVRQRCTERELLGRLATATARQRGKRRGAPGLA